MASDYEDVEEEWRGVRRATEEGTWRKTTGGRGGRRGILDLLFGKRLTWKGAGHMASGKWMMRRREDHVDQRGEVDG
jgi:hypothetical protein